VRVRKMTCDNKLICGRKLVDKLEKQGLIVGGTYKTTLIKRIYELTVVMYTQISSLR